MYMCREHAFICILTCLERVIELLQRKKGCLIALCVCVGGLPWWQIYMYKHAGTLIAITS